MDLTKLIQKRSQIKSRITRMKNYFNTIQEQQAKTVIKELQLRRSKLEPCWEEFDLVQSDIEALDDSTEQAKERELFENSYFHLISSIETYIEDHQQTENISEVASSVNQSFHQEPVVQIKLPTISLPTFNGTHQEWMPFVDTFTSLVHDNSTLTTIQKFHYLKSSIKGDAAHIISSLPTSSDNYLVAWDLLKERFENKRILVQSHVQGIFSLPNNSKESASSIRELCDGLHKHLRALAILEQPTEYWDTLLLHIISHKMDPITRREWETKAPSGEMPTLQEMTQFLKDKCQILETMNFKNKLDVRANSKSRTTSNTSTTLSTRDNSCVFCKGNHFNNNCEKFLSLSEGARFQEVKNKKLCINCLRQNHTSDKCRSSSCRKCDKNHHTLLHFNNAPPSKESSPAGTSTSEPQLSLSNYSSQQSHSNVLLSTARIQISDCDGNIHHCRALLDSGSQSSFITEALCNKLQLTTTKANITVSGIGQSVSKMNKEAEIKIHSVHNNFTANVSCFIIKNINQVLPLFAFDPSLLELPPKLVLADPMFYKPAEIDVLLGADIFYDLLCAGQIKLKKNMPTMQKSVFGWLISGPLMLPSNSNNKNRIHCNFSQTVKKQLTKFWELEEPMQQIKKLSRDDDIVERQFTNTTTKHNDNRFIVTLPFKQSPTQLGQSKQLAINRFLSLERRLMKDPALRSEYADFMTEYETLGHMEISEITDNSEAGFFLPHHCVVKDSSSTTKLRVVFDGSAKSTSGLSLNDTLYAGPTVQSDLFSIIIRFRKHRYVITADIEKMYRQIWIAKDDQKYQQIVWRPNSTRPIMMYSLKTVTYGTTIAPFLATRCLQEIAIQERETYHAASIVLHDDFYVDDCLSGTNSIQETVQLQQELTTMLLKNGFTLRKWRSNEPKILHHIPDSPEAILTIDKTDSARKTLGLLWHSTKDVLQYSVVETAPNQTKFIKRQILSIVSQIFDPLGLLGPIIIIAKVILQRLWQYKFGWDEALPLDSFTSWINLYQQLPDINALEISRQVICENPSTIELHGFSDASESAYGACIYIRSKNRKNECTSQLLCAKSRVAPLKSTTIPRLELCGALLLAQLAQRVRDVMKLQFQRCIYWCDSTITLAWIQSESTKWKTFVANRVSEIQELTQIHEWRHVPTYDNPADLLSRGVFPKELNKATTWWNGPIWLNEDEDSWPTKSNLLETEPLELKPTKLVLNLTCNDTTLIDKFSSFRTLQRVTAYCIRFKMNCQSKQSGIKQTGPLTVEEITYALHSLIKLVQMEEFSLELKNLTNQKEVHHNSKLLSLNPFIDEMGIIRVGGRLQKSMFPYTKKHPIVLPAKHKLTIMIAHHNHIKHLHVGPQGLLAILRERYWPISGRNLCKQVVRKCVQCFKFKPKSYNPMMGELPTPRVTESRAFTTTGIDYAGPFLIKDRKTRGAKTTKAYICLFVCFSTKAIHLEIVSDLTTQAFLSALRRFVSRRGICQHLYSDNATNFKGATTELQELATFLANEKTQNALKNAVSEDGINWHFIPARSPHYGGLWEAGVKVTKYHLKRVLGNEVLTFEEMYTVTTQIEACLNSRPLSPLSSDPNDLAPLTPAHFLIGEPLTTIPEPTLLDLPTNRLDKYQHMQRIYQSFWNRWSKEYISELQLRHKWKGKGMALKLKLGDLVLMKEENAPPLKWRLGRITHLHPGSDDIVRVATVRTSNGTTTRAVHQLCQLPIYTEDSSSTDNVIESTSFQGCRNVNAP